MNNPNYRHNKFDHGAWADAGDIRMVGGKKCVMSTDGPSRSTGSPTNYTVTASMTTGGASFELARIGGGAPIPFSIRYRWFDDTTSTNELLGYNTPSAPHLGGMSIGGISCNIGGSQVRNGRLIIQIDEADLTAATNGDYEGFVTIVHTGGIGMSQTRTRNNMRISLTRASTAIQLRKLGTVNLGTWNTTDTAIDDREPYCVYSSTGAYRVTATSPTTGSGGANSFAIENTTVPGDKIDYDLYIDDDNNAQIGGTLMDNGDTVTGMAGTTDTACPGNNASLYVVTTGDLASSSAGSYSGHITLTVEPE